MNISRNSVGNVLRMVMAANEEPVEKGQVEVPDQDQNTRLAGGPAIIFRHYYYELRGPSNQITFSDLASTPKESQAETAKKLTSGYSGHCGDHFQWVSLVIKTNLYEGATHKDSFVVYHSKLNTDGSRNPSSERIYLNGELKKDPRYKTGLVVTPEFLKDNNIFEDNKEGVNEFINIEDSSTSTFHSDPFTDKDINVVLNSTAPGKTYTQWKEETFAYYRLWSTRSNGGELRLPDLTRAKDLYLGTADSQKKLARAWGVTSLNDAAMDTSKENTTETKSLADKNGEAKSNGVFEPVDSQKFDNKEEVTNRFASKEDGDYSSKSYGGGFSIMQDLVRDQKENMKIREAAQRVLMASLNNKSDSSNAEGPDEDGLLPKLGEYSQTGGATGGAPKVTREDNKNMAEYVKHVEKLNTLIK